MIDWPQDLVDDIARRRSVLFLGAGISKNAVNDAGERPKDWTEYLRHAAQHVADSTKCNEIVGCIDANDLLTACELVRKHLRNDVFKRILLEEFVEKRFSHAEIHDHISALDSRFVLTTNFEKIYENRANHIQQNTVIVKSYHDADVADAFRRTQRVVLKVHGSVDSPENAIFSRSDYARARTKYGHFYQLLEALFLTHTFVFLGVSMRDPDIQLLLENYAYRFGGTRPHFMVMSRGSVAPAVLEIMETSMNLHAVLYDSANHHKELADSLKELRMLVDAARLDIVNRQDW
ncbi:MAG: SIR2 family protein [Polyangiaceae bacterium]|nr:SIR2 family protein [Polyangiaceae bacterium]